jgi:hypothetical protein
MASPDLSVLARQVEQLANEVGVLNDVLAIRKWWEGGIYENDYVRVNGVWQIQVLNYTAVYHGLYESGWTHTPPRFVPFFTETFPDNPAGPDVLVEPRPVLWPETAVVPFHYVHPVTGRKWEPA